MAQIIASINAGVPFKNHVETVEKNEMPTADDVAKERKEHDVISGVSAFSREKLQHVDTVEKDVKPDNEAIQKEKSEVEVRSLFGNCILQWIRFTGTPRYALKARKGV